MSVSWKARVPIAGVATWPVMQTSGDGVGPGVRDRRDEVGGAGPRGREDDADAAGRPRVALRHVAGALLVAGEDVAQRRALGERVVERQGRAAGQAEHDLDAVGLERAQERVGGGGRLGGVERGRGRDGTSEEPQGSTGRRTGTRVSPGTVGVCAGRGRVVDSIPVTGECR